MSSRRLIREFFGFTVIEPIVLVTSSLLGIVVFLVRGCWAVLLFVLGVAWAGETVMELMVRSSHGLAMWFVFAAMFLGALVVKRVLAFPMRKLFSGAPRSKARPPQDAPFMAPLPARATIRLASRTASHP